MRMLSRSRLLVAAALSPLALFAFAGRADVPAALDRVPTGASVIFAVPKAANLISASNALRDRLGIPIPDEGLGMVLATLDTPGFNKDGSIAVAATFPPGFDPSGGEEPPIVMVVPIRNFAELTKAMGGTGEGVVEVTIMDDTGYLKDIGGGYAAMSPDRAVVEAFKGTGGNLAAHKAALGAAGAAVADNCDLVIIANIQAVKPMVEQGMQQMQDQMAMAGAMAGQDMTKQTAMFKAAADAALRDGQTAAIGMGVKPAGVALDFAIQFTEGTPSAGLLQGKGKAATLAARLPVQPILFAMAIDTSSAGWKQIFTDMAAMNPGAASGGPFSQMTHAMDKVNGVAFAMGASPAMMSGGLLANTVAYVATSDPQGYLQMQKEGTLALDGKTVEGITYKTTYVSAAVDAGGVQADSWSTDMTFDPADPNMMMMAQQMMGMIFGRPGGPAGYVAAIDNGVVVTMAPNQAILGQVIASAKAGNGFGSDALVKETTAQLQSDRSIEAYIGVKGLLDTASGFMAMFGGGAPFKVPASLPPVAIGGTSDAGGLGFRVYVPDAVINAIKDIAASMQGMGGDQPEEMGEPAEQPGTPPRF